MAHVRMIGTETVSVPLLGNRTVEPNEVVEVDDDLIADYTWPETTWEIQDESDESPESDKDAEPEQADTGREFDTTPTVSDVEGA